MAKKDPKKGTEVAGSFFHPSYYHNSDPLSTGFATTHEQVSDAYAEGQIGAVIDDVAGEDIPIPEKGYE
ncbi:YozQ family protein [Bacillus rubiinfantis]|uniref:YozQ family protein n=1 Tax=Bacillus rubiinfantis TaxID=1499680 RepID=UPI0005A8514A|nr:YozQ family protein [Bacillus rubiinfantis]